ncbi:uncharacterized protein METZ01_LOCUS15524, partial [marine metagenome]
VPHTFPSAEIQLFENRFLPARLRSIFRCVHFVLLGTQVFVMNAAQPDPVGPEHLVSEKQ